MSTPEETREAAARMRTFRGPAAEPIARLLDTLADSLPGPAEPFHDEVLAVARAINGGAP